MMRTLVASAATRTAWPCLCRKAFYTSFPLDRPSWSVSKLLEKPTGTPRPPQLEGDLSVSDIQHLYNLAGLKMPNPHEQPGEFAQLSKEVNQLRRFLSHIQAVSETENLEPVEPLVRIAEPIEFTAELPNGGLEFAPDEESRLGRKVLHTAEKTSGEYLIVED
ncbi:hypothetical protein GQ54DRAFT_177124 [Martensiomyces pterosporus]|nr:hypothetical protein GQ54DRAFT_177124 [Martensiomyces pterosporus]